MSLPYRPWHTHDEEWPLKPGEPVELDVEIWPTSIVVPPGYQLALTVRGKDYEVDGRDAALPNAPYPMKGVGPFLHIDPDDRPPAIFACRNTLHFAAGQAAIPLVADHSRGVSFPKSIKLGGADHEAHRCHCTGRSWPFCLAAPVAAQQYPNRTVTIIVPYPAGGPTDETARHVANFLSKKFGQNFIVENVTGGSTIIATNKVAKATPDGYTLLLHNLQIAANVTLFKNLPFDTAKDIAPVMLVNKNPLVLVGRPGLAPNNLKELIALMKKERLKEALPGFGTTGHLTSALFAQEAKVQIDFIPVSRRGAGDDRSARRPRRSVRRHADVDRVAWSRPAS